eukprot:scaffold66634_cov19-Tisochrysis_lutea.AAC.1
MLLWDEGEGKGSMPHRLPQDLWLVPACPSFPGCPNFQLNHIVIPLSLICSGTLAKDEVIKFSDWAQEAADHNPPVQVDAETIEKFWEDNVCAPGSTENGPLIGGGKYGEVGENGGGLCKRCKTDCTSEDPYAGYDGAVHCIDDDDGNQFTGGDIAFVKHSTLRDYNGPNLNTAKNQYVGICPTKEDGSSGGCMTLFDAAGNPIKD